MPIVPACAWSDFLLAYQPDRRTHLRRLMLLSFGRKTGNPWVFFLKIRPKCPKPGRISLSGLNEWRYIIHQKHDGSNVEPVIQGNRIYIQFSANRADISNLTPYEIVSVYSVNGMMELSSKAGPDGRISIPNLPGGIHILKANHTNIKFVIR